MSILDKLSQYIPYLSKSKETREFFFALNISSDKVEGAVWGLEGNKLRIVSKADRGYKSLDGLSEAANYCLDEALADFQPEPTKVLFGVPDSWLQDDDLKEEYLNLIRKMVRELDISPMAYVSTTQAISHFLQKQQGVPLTSILVKLADPLLVTVVKAGNNLGTKELKRSANLPEDIEKALLSFTGIEVLPSKILLYGQPTSPIAGPTGEEDKFKDELQSFSWMSQLPFLHLPKIDDLDKDITISSVCLAGASEINPDAQFSEEVLSQDFRTHPTKSLQEEGLEGENFGFVKGDIEQKEELSLEEHGHQDKEEELLERPKGKHLTLFEKVKSATLAPFRYVAQPEGEESFLARLLRRNTLIFLTVLIVALFGSLLLLPKAKVTVFIDLRVLERDSQVTADPQATKVDEENKIIPGKIVETSVSGSDKASSTGKKQVGDPGRGKVILYNKTNLSKNLSQGTILTGPGNLKFNLDTSVQIASQSSTTGADFATIIKPGKTDPEPATALAIGPEGNLSAGTELSVAGFSQEQIIARVDSAFSGGVSKDVTVVTSDDQKKLLAKLSSDLRKKAKDEIQGKLTGDQKILEEALSEDITKKTFSKNVNDQAQDFNLTLAIKYKGTSYSEADLKSMVSKLVSTNVPGGFELDLSKTETQADVSKLEKDKLIFLAKFRAKLMPKLDQKNIKKQLRGKTPQEAADKLKTIENVIGSNIEITPSLPIKQLQRLPLLEQNIFIEVTAK